MQNLRMLAEALLFLSLLLHSIAAFSQSPLTGMSYVSGISLRPSWNGLGPAVHFVLNSPVIILNQCPHPSVGNQPQPHFHVSAANPLFKETYAMLLAADAAKRKVSIHVGSCHTYSQEVLWLTLRQPSE